MKFYLTSLMFFACCCGLVSSCGRGRGRRCPPRDRTKPTITCPPNRHEYADPFQINTKVWWDEKSVVANDNRDGSIKPYRRGKAPGKLFSEGVTRVRYHARDRAGNYASCYFTITVQVLRCDKWGEVNDGWKICHVSHDMRRGSICRFGCYAGFERVGPSKTTCLDTEQWDTTTQPYCQKLKCPELFPTSGQYDTVDISCTDDNYFRSKCSYNCKAGYSVLPGHSKVRVCTKYGIWLGSTPICVDTEPPKFSGCPHVVVGYAESSKTTGRILWNDPIATDNSGGVTVTLSGPTPITELDVGEHTVKYTARDAVNNTAICEFKVVVKQIKCHTIYPLPYTHINCPDGRIFGSSCLFTCDNGTSLNGHAHAQCDKEGSIVPYGAWTFDNSQPYCEMYDRKNGGLTVDFYLRVSIFTGQNSCADLRAPDNGALACDTWLQGRYCQMLCQEGYVVMDEADIRVHKSLLVCGDSGNWYISGDIPNCQEVEDSRSLPFFRINIEYLYYEGNCEESKDDIKNKFIQAFSNSDLTTCTPPACSVSSVQVICGESSSDSDRKRKAVTSEVSGQVTLEMSNDLTPADIVKSRNSIRNAMRHAAANGDLDLNGTSPEITVSQPERNCSEGSAYKKSTFECVVCNKGYYHDQENDVCARCPRGNYQDESKQTSCKSCPSGTTTETKGAYSSSQCKEACPAGFNSSTGTKPCSPCDLGWYSENSGSIECTPCPGSQITVKAGATSLSQCREFDVSYSQLDDTELLTVASLNIEDPQNSFVLTFFVKCEKCGNILNIFGTDGQTVVSVSNVDQLRVGLNGHQYETGKNITGTMMWTQVTVKSTGDEFIAHMNEEEILREPVSNRKRRSVTTLNATLGGEGFIGSISQLNMWSDVDAFTLVTTDTCFKTGNGDLINWGKVSELDGSFVLRNSNCDVDDDCKSSPCQNGATCTDSVGSFSCTCMSGFTGNMCETNIDDCFENPCDNNGTCIDGEDGFSCACTYGFTGDLCETHFVDGGWAEWESNSECSVTCGAGVQQYSRVCENPVPINGGKQCEGENTKSEVCETNTACVNECVDEPTQIANGSMNCEWINETRICKPTCDEGFDFDDDRFIGTSGITCGPDTGYEWNNKNPDNPLAEIPSCTLKTKAVSNNVNATFTYNMSSNTMNPEVESKIKAKVNSKTASTGCVATGRCSLDNLYVDTSEESSDRKRRDVGYVTFTIELTCYITGDIDECYNLLAEVIAAINTYIEQQELMIQYDGNDYDVITNSSSLSGTSECETGTVPVWHYCVSCGKGTYATQGYCEWCERGYYQDEEAQTSCKQCPEGWTTEGLMTRNVIYCDVSNPIDSGDVTNMVLIVIVFAASVVIFVLVVIATFYIYKRFHSQKTTPHHANGVSGNRDTGTNANSRFQRGNLNRPNNADGIEMTDVEPMDFAATNKAREARGFAGAYENPAYEASGGKWDFASYTTKRPLSPPPRYSSPPLVKKNAWTDEATDKDLY